MNNFRNPAPRLRRGAQECETESNGDTNPSAEQNRYQHGHLHSSLGASILCLIGTAKFKVGTAADSSPPSRIRSDL